MNQDVMNQDVMNQDVMNQDVMNQEVGPNEYGLYVRKLNESSTVIRGPVQTLEGIHNFLKVERPGAMFDPLVKAGFKSKYDYYTTVSRVTEPVPGSVLTVMNGHLPLLGRFGVVPDTDTPEFTDEFLSGFITAVQGVLPFAPYDYQLSAFKDCVRARRYFGKAATGSGKSLIISLIAEFFRQLGRRGLLIVPNVNLLTQFKNDIADYRLTELHADTHVIGGGCTEFNFDSTFTISTWQSLAKHRDGLSELDYIIGDEAHRTSAKVFSEILQASTACRYKIGLTGTIPDDPCARMQVVGLFGLPRTVITTRELIDRGLATELHVNSVFLKYNHMDRGEFLRVKGYVKQIQFLKEHTGRTDVLVKLLTRVRCTGNTLGLYQHTVHGKEIFTGVMRALYPNVEVRPRDITGKKSFEFQERYGVYFLNGEDNADTRERTRAILEEHADAVLVANYSLLSTGVNIRKLHNLVLLSPLKSFTTVTQSLGRILRLHESKTVANLYDVVDDFGLRKPAGMFVKQYKHRLVTSYNAEQFPVTERTVQMP